MTDTRPGQVTSPAGTAELHPLQIEANGINMITDAERKGSPRDLFWPWFAANVSVLGLSYGAFVLGFGVSFWQGLIAGLVGIAVLTVAFIALVADKIHWPTVAALPAGSPGKVIGALVFMMTGFGLGWVNAAADYSRYLPGRSSGPGVVAWTTFGSSIAPIFLFLFGLLLAGSSASLSSAIANDPSAR